MMSAEAPCFDKSGKYRVKTRIWFAMGVIHSCNLVKKMGTLGIKEKEVLPDGWVSKGGSRRRENVREDKEKCVACVCGCGCGCSCHKLGNGTRNGKWQQMSLTPWRPPSANISNIFQDMSSARKRWSLNEVYGYSFCSYLWRVHLCYSTQLVKKM